MWIRTDWHACQGLISDLPLCSTSNSVHLIHQSTSAEWRRKLGLSKEHTLIDLGTGPGLLALGFAAYVGLIVGVDPEPAMVGPRGKRQPGLGKVLP